MARSEVDATERTGYTEPTLCWCRTDPATRPLAPAVRWSFPDETPPAVSASVRSSMPFCDAALPTCAGRVVKAVVVVVTGYLGARGCVCALTDRDVPRTPGLTSALDRGGHRVDV